MNEARAGGAAGRVEWMLWCLLLECAQIGDSYR
jgi:hypothetical protein